MICCLTAKSSISLRARPQPRRSSLRKPMPPGCARRSRICRKYSAQSCCFFTRTRCVLKKYPRSREFRSNGQKLFVQVAADAEGGAYMKQRSYKLEEAIKELYDVEPLRGDLATGVAHRIFEPQKAAPSMFERLVVPVLSLVAAVSMIYAIYLLLGASIVVGLVFVIAVTASIGLALKEYFVLLKRLHIQS